MRIGINTLFLIPSEVGGSETIFTETLSEVVRLFPKEFFVLFTNLENNSYLKSHFEKFPQISFQLLNFHARNRFARILREQFELPNRIKEEKVDLLWSPGYTMPLSAPCPQVVSILDVQYKSYPEDLGLIARLTTQFLVSNAAKRVKRILTLSEFSKSEIVHYFKVPEAKVTVSLCAANPEFAKSYSKDERDRIVSKIVPLDKPYLLCVANSYPHKNLVSLAQAFKTLLSDIPHRLVIAGRPARGETLLKQVLSEIPKDRIIRTEYVHRPDLIPLYQNADIFILPSLYEGFGLPVLEAMMAGVPVLTTKCASIPEVGGDTVFYFDSKSREDLAGKIKSILGLSQTDRERIIQKAKERAQSFSWEISARKVMECFEKAGRS